MPAESGNPCQWSCLSTSLDTKTRLCSLSLIGLDWLLTINARQTGQLQWVESHLSIQLLWNKCLQELSCRSSSPCIKTAKQIGHSSSFPSFEFTSITNSMLFLSLSLVLSPSSCSTTLFVWSKLSMSAGDPRRPQRNPKRFSGQLVMKKKLYRTVGMMIIISSITMRLTDDIIFLSRRWKLMLKW